MELRHLRYFAAVAEEQNITKAAVRLHVSQPPLSRQIRDLEEELGVALLERGAKSVKLTGAGRIFPGQANAVLARAEQERDAVRAFANQCTGELHVARGVCAFPNGGAAGPRFKGFPKNFPRHASHAA